MQDSSGGPRRLHDVPSLAASASDHSLAAHSNTAHTQAGRQGEWYSRNVGGVHEVPDGCVDSKAAGDADHDIQGLVLDLWAAGTARQRAARAKGCEA